jgi:hypothetical protein
MSYYSHPHNAKLHLSVTLLLQVILFSKNTSTSEICANHQITESCSFQIAFCKIKFEVLLQIGVF